MAAMSTYKWNNFETRVVTEVCASSITLAVISSPFAHVFRPTTCYSTVDETQWHSIRSDARYTRCVKWEIPCSGHNLYCFPTVSQLREVSGSASCTSTIIGLLWECDTAANWLCGRSVMWEQSESYLLFLVSKFTAHCTCIVITCLFCTVVFIYEW